jgi:uncharacterized protein (TIGR03086 family)
MTAIADHYRALAAEFTRRVEAVPATRWDEQSPCPEWTARDVLRHVVGTHRDAPTWAGLANPLDRSVDLEPAAAWAEARDSVQAILDDPELAGREFDGHFGRTSLEQAVDRFLAFDLLIHGWDIARATGQEETLPPEEVGRAYQGALQMGDSLHMDGVCGPAVEVGEGASEQDRLLALVGRQP